MKDTPKTIYLCGAGGKGNIGAEAIMLAIIKLFQQRYENPRFIFTSWYPGRVREILSRIEGNFLAVRKESIFDNPLEILRSDIFVLCGDVSISETVVSFLPIYYAIRIATAKLLGKKVILLGIEAETIRKKMNLLAIKYLIGKTADFQIARNEESYENLKKMQVPESALLLGCEPSLTLLDSHCEGFEYENGAISDTKLRVGFGIRDFFSAPFKLNLLKMKLERRDVSTGELTDQMKCIIDFTARIGNYLIEEYDAQLIFIPHHYLPEGERVIMTDREVAEMVIAKLRDPKDVVILEENLHPFTVLSFYKRLDLVFSMRHHTNSFACHHHVPTFGYAIAEKIFSFFKHIGKEDMLIDPMDGDFDGLQAKIDRAIREKERIAGELKNSLAVLRSHMDQALDIALKEE